MKIWQSFPSDIKLKNGDVHLISAELSENTEVTKPYWELLSDNERTRANQFRFDKHRNVFVMARGILRLILSRYTHEAANAIEFKYLEHGKPALNNYQFANLHFNLSHSGNMAMYAITSQFDIGVDIEMMKASNELELAERFFAKQEYAELSAVLDELRQARFFTIWTMKEAFIKALGTGLFQALNQFTVSAENGGKLLDCHDNHGPADAWYLQVFQHKKDYQVAFATKQSVKQVFYWEWQN